MTFNKLAIDLVTECETSSSGNKQFPHYHWSPHRMARGFSNTRQISRYHSIHIHQSLPSSPPVPWIHTVKQQHWIQVSANGPSTSTTWHWLHLLCTLPPSKQWEIRSLSQVSETYTQETLPKVSIKFGQIHQSSSHQLQSDTHPCHSRNTIFSCLWQRSKPTITPTSETNTMIPRWSRIWVTQPGSPSSSPSHCKEHTRWKPLQDYPENHRQRTTILQNRWQSLFQKQTTRQMGPQMETWIQNCQYWVWWTLPTHWKSSYWKNKVLQHQGCSTWTSSGILEHQHTIWQSWEIHQPPCKFANYHALWLKMNTLLMYIVTCKLLALFFFPAYYASAIHTGELGVSIIPTSIESLPHMSFLYHHSSCIFGKSGEAM